MPVYRINRVFADDIVKLAAPVVFAMLTQTAINLADTVMVAWLPRSYSIAGQAAIGHSQIVLWLIGGFLAAISVGTQALTARRWGENDPLRAGQVLTNSAFLALVLGATLSIVATLLVPLFFPLINPNPTVVRLGVPYCQWRLIGIFSMVATASFKSFFDGTGRTYVHLSAAIVMNAANILLNWLFIFGVGPFPQLYVTGAGLASAIASYLGLAVMVVWTLRPTYRRTYRYYRLRNLSAAVCKEIGLLSVQAGTATVFVMLGFGAFLMIVSHLDVRTAETAVSAVPAYAAAAKTALIEAVRTVPFVHDVYYHGLGMRPAVFTAAAQVIISVLSLSFMSSIAFGTATATLVSKSLGEGQPARAETYGWESVKIFALIMAVLSVVVVGWPRLVLYLFSHDAEVVAAAAPALRLMGFSLPLIATGLILAQALFGAGNTRYVMLVEMVLHVFCLMPLAYVLGVVLDLGLVGVWAAAFVYVVALSAAMAFKFREGRWKLIRL